MTGRSYYFLHIPKTAGTSVGAWIKANFDFRFCPEALWSQLLARDHATLSDYDFFGGHFYTGLADYLNRDLVTLTFLRHPVQRSLSHYLHIMREDDHYLHERARKLGSFTAFMRDPACLPMLYNFQTRALSMEFDPAELRKNLENRDNHPYALERLIESSLDGYSSTVNLPRAMAFLDRCAFVGLTERMEESAAELQRVLGVFGNPGFPRKLNLAANKSDVGPLTADEYKQLIALVSDDIALYEYAKLVCWPKAM